MDLVGVLHLLPLPAGPVRSPGLQAVQDRAWRDAEALVEGGIRSAVLENLGDAPFSAGPVEPHVVAMMAVLARGIAQRFGADLALGINVLRHDGRAALGIAAAVGARFVRINVHTGAAWTDQGLIQGRAAADLRYRRELDLEPIGPAVAGWLHDGSPGLRIAADVHVKHASPAGAESIEDAAADLALRGRADLVIVSGRHTGGETALDDIDRVRARIPGHPLWVGSGATPMGLGPLRGRVDGVIVGTWLHQEGDLSRPLDANRVARLVEAAS